MLSGLKVISIYFICWFFVHKKDAGHEWQKQKYAGHILTEFYSIGSLQVDNTEIVFTDSRHFTPVRA